MLAAVPPPPDDDREIIPPEILPLADLLEEVFPPIVWTVPGLLARGNCDMLAGKAKMGKSRLALSIALAIAMGGYALGKFKVVQGDVLYLALEDGKRRLQSRLRKMLEPERNPDLSHFFSSCEWSPVDEGGIEFLEQWIDQAGNPTLIVIDTLIRVKPAVNGKKPLYDQDYASIRPLFELAHRRNVGILIIHHTRKADAEDWLDEVSGSTGITASTDGTIILKRKRGKKDATLNVVGRDLIDELSLALVADDLTGGWTYTGNAEDVELSEQRLAILRRLEDRPDGFRVRELAASIGKTDQATWNLLDKLKEEGLAETTRYGPWRITIKGSLLLAGPPKNTHVNGVTERGTSVNPAKDTPDTRDTRPISENEEPPF